MTYQYLLEIGLEEVPARFLRSLSEQLKERMSEFLSESRVKFASIDAYATPRRLTVVVNGLASQQDDFSEIAKGPALKIAKDEEGNWSKAALGFLRGQGAKPEDIFIETIKGVEYIHVNKFIKGQAIEEILQSVPKVLQAMTFPVTMQWNTIDTPFIRPIHWIVSLLDNQVVPFEFVGVNADRQSRGHRFLGHDVLIESAATYLEQLEAEFVIADFNQRQATIRQQIEALAKEKNWLVPIDEDLLEEVTSIVEWPTVFYGEFEESYLEVPEQVLITAMRDHQRYFYAMNSQEQLLPVFISVRNGNAEHLEQVIKGNKKVLKARLEDALFFYQEDLKHDLDFYLEKLEHVNEHFKLGSLADKQRRVEAMIATIGPMVDADEPFIHTALQAAKVYKYDLMTQTVGEFDELQGEIGAVYASHYGINEEIATAIAEQYLPKTSGGVLPSTPASKLLTLADKLDTLIQYFNVGLVPTGSNDPYALRRQATGVVEITLDSPWQFDLNSLLLSNELVKSDEALFNTLQEFFKARIAVQLEKEQIDYDIIQAVVAAEGLNIKQKIKTANDLQQLKEQHADQYRQVVESVTRVVNLGAKVQSNEAIDVALSQTESEKTLINFVQSLGLGNLIDTLKQLDEPIRQYFEENMVNDENEVVRANRYATMKHLTDYVLTYVDPRNLISKF